MKPHFQILLLLFPLLYFHQIQAQGCSDAGFCTLGALKPDQHFTNRKKLKIRTIEINQYYGITRFHNNIFATNFDFTFSLGEKNAFQLKIPFMMVFGRLGNTQNIGDISLSYTRNLITKDEFQLNATIGAKIPTNNSDLTNENGLPLPMYYQTSLGTYDAILGVSIITRDWLIATGIQHPFNTNNNQFQWSKWREDPLWTTSLDYAESANLRRGTDVMLRVERNFRWARFNTHIGLLGIQRITPDVMDIGIEEGHVSRAAQGLALNLLVGFGYQFSVNSGLKFIFGHQLLERIKNPDGLSREQVLTLAYQFNF